MMKKMFSNLHCHSDYSIFDGFAKLPDLVSRAKELDYGALALTDHGTTTGLMPFYKECTKQGVKPILGYEGYFTIQPNINCDGYFHIILLAKDMTGYRNLMRIATYASYHFYRKPRIGIDILKQYHEGIICTTACIAGIFKSPDWNEIRDSLISIFGDDFYLEIQPHNFDEQREYNKAIMTEADSFHLPVIATIDSHYVNKEDIQYHKRWLNLGETNRYYSSNDFFLRSGEEIEECFLQDGFKKQELIPIFNHIENIVSECDVQIPVGQEHYPVFDSDNPERYIRDCCNKGYFAKGINKKPNKQVYIDRVIMELGVLKQVHYLNYFCIVKDMLNYCRENSIPTGCGRGSVGGSCVAYLMGITDIDPIANDLIFERFTNTERVTTADKH